MPFREFEHRFAPLLIEPGKTADAANMFAKMGSSIKKLVTRPEARDESDQAVAEIEEGEKRGTAKCLVILKRANLFEHRHYAFGRTLVFLRNGVEGALLAAVQKQMQAITWFQKEARMRQERRRFAYARHVIIKTQAAMRRNHAKVLVRRRLARIRKRRHALRMGYFAVKIAKWASRYAPPFLAKRRAAALQCQRYARGYLGKRKLARQRFLADRSRPINKLRWIMQMVCVMLRAARRMAALVARRKLAVVNVQRFARGVGPRGQLRRKRAASLQLQRCHRSKAGAATAATVFDEAVNSAFSAAFNDDEEALRAALKRHPWLVLVRQNLPEQRASMAHAAAAGGAVLVAPFLLTTMHKAAIACGAKNASRASVPDDATSDEHSHLELAAAVAYAQGLLDVQGRTPLHYAARWCQLDFVHWCVRVLSLRPKSSANAVVPEAPGGADASAEEADDEVRRAVVSVVLPTGGSRQKVLLVLGQAKLKVYGLPAADGSKGAPPDASALDVASLGKPKLALAADKALYRKSADRLKKDCLEVVIVKARKGGVAARMAVFEQSQSEDILEIYAGSPTATRYWLAAFHSPRYLKARGEHLLNAVEGGKGSELQQTDLWLRWALLNRPDTRSEGLLCAALRGVEAGEHIERCRLIAYLLDAGAEAMPMGIESPATAAAMVKRASESVVGGAGASPLALEALVSAGGALALLLSCASQSVGPAADHTWSEILALIMDRAVAKYGQSSFEPLRLSLREAYRPALTRAAKTLAVLMGEAKKGGAPAAASTSAVAPPGGFAVGGGLPAAVSAFPPLPTPSPAASNSEIHLLEISRVDLAGSEIDLSESAAKHLHVRVAFMHEPTEKQAAGESAGGAATAPKPAAASGGVAARMAAFKQLEGGGSEKLPAGRTDRAESRGAAAGKRSRLVPLIGEMRTSAPVGHGSTAAWFQQTWHAPYLPGEEGALLVLKLMGGPTGSELQGWVALPIENVGEQHIQLHAPPLPSSSAEARAARSEPLPAWVHCELARGVTGSHAKFVEAHPNLVLRQTPTTSRLQDATGPAAKKLARHSTAVFQPTIGSPTFQPQRGRVLSEEQVETLADLPAPPMSLEGMLAMSPPSSAPSGEPELRGYLVRVLTATSAAATHGKPALALRGYAVAFSLSRTSSYLLAAANMLIKMGELDQAAAMLQHLAANDAGLSADQKSILSAKQEQVCAAQADGGAEDHGAGVARRRARLLNKRASTAHLLMDRQALDQLQSGEEIL